LNWNIRIAFSSFIRGALFPLLFYFISGLSATPSAYFTFVAVWTLVDCTAGALSLFLVAALPTLDNASSAFTLLTTFVGTASGFFLRPNLIPPWFIWAYYLSFLKYALDALYYNEYEDHPEILLYIFEVDPTFDKWGNVMMLVMFNVVFSVLAYAMSYWKTKTKEAKDHDQ
jgi:ABC-type multidrug transport system permease subunit